MSDDKPRKRECITHHNACDCREEMLAKRIEVLKAELAACIKTHDENIGVLHEFQKIFKNIEPEISKRDERIAELEEEIVRLTARSDYFEGEMQHYRRKLTLANEHVKFLGGKTMVLPEEALEGKGE